MSNQDQAAQVIRTWQQRHKNAMDDNPEWAAQNLAIDLQRAGLIAPQLPEPNDPNIFLFVPDGKDWLPLGSGDTAVWTAPGSLIMVERIEPGEFTADEARRVAYSVLAAADYSEGKQ